RIHRSHARRARSRSTTHRHRWQAARGVLLHCRPLPQLPPGRGAPMTPLPPEHSTLLHRSPKDLEATIAMLETHDCDIRRIELSGTTDKSEILTRIASALIFPDWFGHNWDALADCLGDLSWLPTAHKRAVLFIGLD